MAEILADWGEFSAPAENGLRVSPADAERISGWILKPEGMCRDELCVPLPADARRDGKIDLAAFWQTLGHPVLSDKPGNVWVLGTGPKAGPVLWPILKHPILPCPILPACHTACPICAARRCF